MTNLTVGRVATTLGVGFAAYFAARSLWWTVELERPLLALAATVLYLAVVAVTIFLRARGGRGLPGWWGVVVLLTVLVIPLAVTRSLRPEDVKEPFATWYLGALGLLSIVCIVRRRPLWGWLALVALAVSAMFSLGPLLAWDLGLIGSTSWVIMAQLLVKSWDRAVRDTEHLAGIQQTASAWRATQRVRQRERRVRVQYALRSAGPVLTRTVESKGWLTEEERLQARLAEGQLRDELRGAALLNAEVRDAIEAARRQGIIVTVFDEGGLDDIDEGRREDIRNELAAVLRSARTQRVIVRAGRNDDIAVTVVGRAGGSSLSEEDAVDLWHEIPRRAQ